MLRECGIFLLEVQKSGVRSRNDFIGHSRTLVCWPDNDAFMKPKDVKLETEINLLLIVSLHLTVCEEDLKQSSSS